MTAVSDEYLRPRPTRAALQRELERIVADNRVTIAVVFPAIGAITLVASAEGLLPDPLAFNPWLILFGTLVMRSPLLVGIAPRVGKRALGFLAVLTTYTWIVEYVGVRTGWPYGSFEYAVQLGPLIVGAVPLALPLFFVPLVLNAYLLTILVLDDRGGSAVVRVPAAILAIVAIDLVLDPAAVAIGFWTFDAPGPYYGVPWSNYAGWLLSGTVAVALVDRAFDRTAVLERIDRRPFVMDDMVSFVLLWGGINALYGNLGPVVVAIGLGLALLSTGHYAIPGRRPTAADHRD